MELTQLKVKAFDLIAAKETYLIQVEKLTKEIQETVEKIKKLEEQNGIK